MLPYKRCHGLPGETGIDHRIRLYHIAVVIFNLTDFDSVVAPIERFLLKAYRRYEENLAYVLRVLFRVHTRNIASK